MHDGHQHHEHDGHWDEHSSQTSDAPMGETQGTSTSTM